jgi:hypothetical protein
MRIDVKSILGATEVESLQATRDASFDNDDRPPLDKRGLQGG